MSHPSPTETTAEVAAFFRSAGKQMLAWEVLSFAFLCVFAVGLLGMNSFTAARIFFAISAVVLAAEFVSLARQLLTGSLRQIGYLGSLVLAGVYCVLMLWWVAQREIKPDLVFSAATMADAHKYPPGHKIASIEWKPVYADIRLDLMNKRVAIENLDLKIIIDRGLAPTSIAKVGQISGCADFTAVPFTAMRAATKEATAEGGDYVHPIEPEPANIAFAPIWRVTCSRLNSNSTLHLVIAALSTAGANVSRLEGPRRIEVHALQCSKSTRLFLLLRFSRFSSLLMDLLGSP
jgi:hypothetical protein